MPDQKSLADVLSGILAERKTFATFVALLLVICLLALGVIHGILRGLPPRTSEVTFGAGSISGHILFSQAVIFFMASLLPPAGTCLLRTVLESARHQCILSAHSR